MLKSYSFLLSMLETNNKATCIYKFCNLHQVTACFESYCIAFCVKLQRNMNEVTNQEIYHWTTISVSLLSSICSIVSIPKLGQSIRIIQVVCLMQWSSHSMANEYHSRINENNLRLRPNALESRKRMDRKDIGKGAAYQCPYAHFSTHGRCFFACW